MYRCPIRGTLYLSIYLFITPQVPVVRKCLFTKMKLSRVQLKNSNISWCCANIALSPPNVHSTSRYVTACDKFYQAFPHVSNKINAGLKRLGCKAVLF